MTVLALPAIPGFQSLNWDLSRNVAVAASPLGRTVQRLVRSGDQWMADLQAPLYNNDDAGVLAAWLEQAARGDRWFYLSPPQNSVRGGWAPADLVSNGGFTLGTTTGWTADGSTLSVNTRRLKIKSNAAAASSAYQNITMEAGKPHAVIADAQRGASSTAVIEVGPAAGGVELTIGGTAPVRLVGLVAPTVAAMRIRMWQNAAAAQDIFYSGASITRCLQVNGASQTGNRLNVSGGPANVNAALKAGEFVCVKVGTLYQLLRLVEDFDSDGSGTGTLVIEPALRGSPADQAAVIVRNPFARFMLPAHSSVHGISAPLLHGVALKAVEDITP